MSLRDTKLSIQALGTGASMYVPIDHLVDLDPQEFCERYFKPLLAMVRQELDPE